MDPKPAPVPAVRRRRWIRRLLASGLAVLLALLVCELALRILGLGFPNFYRWDPNLGSALRPGAEGTWTREGRSQVKINTLGMRDLERAVDKPAGRYRIAVLGDSYAEAFQVERDATFWVELERQLAACGDPSLADVEVLNFGVAGYGTAQQLLAFRERVVPFAPDLVLLAFLPANDVRNNHRTLEGDPYRPYFTLQQGKLTLDDSFAQSPEFLSKLALPHRIYDGVVARSRLLQLINEARARRQSRVAVAAAGTIGDEPGLDDRIYLPPTDPDWIDAWQVSEALVLQLRDEVRAAGAEFLLVTLSSGVQVDPDPAVRARFRARLGVQDLFHADDRIEAFARNHGIAVVSLARPLRRIAESGPTYLHGFEATPGRGHWNENGHGAAGALIADYLCNGSDGAGAKDASAAARSESSSRSGRPAAP